MNLCGVVYLAIMMQLTFVSHLCKAVMETDGPPPFILARTNETKGGDNEIVHLSESHMEPCPPDSITSGDSCECFHELCEKPSCNFTLTQLTESTDVPGLCCPTYSCIGCPNDTTIDGKCPCAEGAVISSSGVCECVDPTKTIVDGKCTCKPDKCQLPHICDQKSVTVKENDVDGCCTITKCIPCPEDSYSTNYDDQLIEDKCVCSPCPSKTCKDNEKVIVFRRGNNFPGTCCDLYACEPIGEKTGCKSNGTYYEEGAVWTSVEGETCRCRNGIFFCSSIGEDQEEEKKQHCVSEGRVIPHATSWLEDDECTNCTCIEGDIKCLSHFCDVIIDKIENPSKEMQMSCNENDKVYNHLDSWNSSDGCSVCTCNEGKKLCTPQSCQKESNPRFCTSEGKRYSHEETWIIEKCTQCSCIDGAISCTKNESCNNVCISKDNMVYPEKYSWKEDDCTRCTCIFGNAKCINFCTSTSDCPGLEGCKKKCENGYKVNKKGCEICKCKVSGGINGSSSKEDNSYLGTFLKTYNLSEDTVIAILKNVIRKESSTFVANKNEEQVKNSFEENSNVGTENEANEDREKISMFFVGFSGGVLLSLVLAISLCVFRIHKQRTKQKFSPCDYKLVDLIEMDKNKNISNIYTQKNFELKNAA